MPHKRGPRSLAARQKRAAIHYILNKSYRDYREAETVQVTTQEQVLEELRKRFGEDGVNVHLDFMKGEVLSNARGNGSLQRLPPQKSKQFNGKRRE